MKDRLPSSIFDSSQSFVSFGNLHLDYRLVKSSVQAYQLQFPTCIQKQSIPFIVEGRDVFIGARTGSGKTLAYALPLLHRLLQPSKRMSACPTRAVILVPSRELCQQVHNVLYTLLKYCRKAINSAAITDSHATLVHDAPPHVFVTTPRSLLELIEAAKKSKGWKIFNLCESLEMLVIDEADLIYSLGFRQDMQDVEKCLPKSTSAFYQVILCSATLNSDVEQLRGLMLHKPVVLNLQISESEGLLTEYYAPCVSQDRWLLTYGLLRLHLVPMKCLIYTSTIDRAYFLSHFLERFSIKSCVLSPLLTAEGRQNSIQAFNQNLVELMIACDSIDEPVKEKKIYSEKSMSVKDLKGASNTSNTKKLANVDGAFASQRGLDLQDVSCVLNVDCPKSYSTYLHRIGRTARAGAAGVTVTIVESDVGSKDHVLLEKIQKTKNKQRDPEIKLLPIRIEELEGLRYRVDSVTASLSKRCIEEIKRREVHKELLHCERLKKHFDANPADVAALQSSRRTITGGTSDAPLKEIPEYLITWDQTKALTPVQSAISSQGYSTQIGVPANKIHKKGINPLWTFSSDKIHRNIRDRQIKKKRDLNDPSTASLSGRKLWKLRHRKHVKNQSIVSSKDGKFLKRRPRKRRTKKQK